MWLHQFLTWTATREFQGRTSEMLVLVFALTVVSASISWAIVERPALRWKDASWRHRAPPGKSHRPTVVADARTP